MATTTSNSISVNAGVRARHVRQGSVLAYEQGRETPHTVRVRGFFPVQL